MGVTDTSWYRRCYIYLIQAVRRPSPTTTHSSCSCLRLWQHSRPWDWNQSEALAQLSLLKQALLRFPTEDALLCYLTALYTYDHNTISAGYSLLGIPVQSLPTLPVRHAHKRCGMGVMMTQLPVVLGGPTGMVIRNYVIMWWLFLTVVTSISADDLVWIITKVGGNIFLPTCCDIGILF
jgi:hypothetical protein